MWTLERKGGSAARKNFNAKDSESEKYGGIVNNPCINAGVSATKILMKGKPKKKGGRKKTKKGK